MREARRRRGGKLQPHLQLSRKWCDARWYAQIVTSDCGLPEGSRVEVGRFQQEEGIVDENIDRVNGLEVQHRNMVWLPRHDRNLGTIVDAALRGKIPEADSIIAQVLYKYGVALAGNSCGDQRLPHHSRM